MNNRLYSLEIMRKINEQSVSVRVRLKIARSVSFDQSNSTLNLNSLFIGVFVIVC